MTSKGISFFVSGDAKGQPRPRAFAMKMGNGKFSARVFDSGTAEGWKSLIALSARDHHPIAPISGPVSVSLRFVFKRPANHWSGGKTRFLKDTSPTMHIGKPDSDNLAKAVLDCLTQTGYFWRDDSQVSRLYVEKTYPPDELHKPGCFVTIEEI